LNCSSQPIIAGNFDRATNPHLHPTDFAHEILIRQMQILAGSITFLLFTTAYQKFIISFSLCCETNVIKYTQKVDSCQMSYKLNQSFLLSNSQTEYVLCK